MNIKRCLQPSAQANCASAALLLVRVVVGAAFLFHGWGKMQNPMAWMGPEAPVPGILQFLAAFSEFGGGLALILGLLVPLAAFGLTCTMLVATCMHAFVRQDPFVSMTGGPAYELALVYLSLSLMFLVIGPGKFSADAKIFGAK